MTRLLLVAIALTFTFAFGALSTLTSTQVLKHSKAEMEKEMVLKMHL